MDLPPPAPATVRAHGSDIETSTRLQPNNMGNCKQPASHLTNGAVKRHELPLPITIGYGKCLKNYAATTGGQVLDGCGEFMPSPTTSPLHCDACGCHRSFHRLEADQVVECQCQHRQAPPNDSSTPDSQSPPPISSSYYPAPPHIFIPLNPGLAPPEPANNNLHPSIITPAVATGTNPQRKKRFRSKFSDYQKAKMQEFAERIGWKTRKTEEEMILGFCKNIGVTKAVFKVWMHNHKSISNPGNRNSSHQNQGDTNGNAIGANGSLTSS